MTKKDDEKKLLEFLRRYPTALREVAIRVRAWEMTLQDLKADRVLQRYMEHKGDLESRKPRIAEIQEWSDLDQIIDLLTRLTEESEKKK
jgi:hypothetical protein